MGYGSIMDTETPMPFGWLSWARRVQAIAQNGLTYAKDPFDQERYAALRALAAEVVAEYAGVERGDVSALFAGEVGYATPKLDVRAAVFRAEADGAPALLLVRERSDGGWTLPGGWVDAGESPSEAAEKEVREESGYTVRATKLLALLDRDRHGPPPLVFSVWKAFLRCEIVAAPPDTDGAAATQPNPETDAVRFFRAEEIADLPLSHTRVVASQIALVFAHYRQPDRPADFD